MFPIARYKYDNFRAITRQRAWMSDAFTPLSAAHREHVVQTAWILRSSTSCSKGPVLSSVASVIAEDGRERMLCLIDIDRFRRDSRKGDEFQVRLLWYQAWNDLKNEGFWADEAILVVGCIAGMLRTRTREDEFSWQKPYTSIVHSSHLLSDHINAHLEYTRPQPVPSVPVYITFNWMRGPMNEVTMLT